ncbi:MAG TPA: phenylalanine--tRNA ligase subunit beta [Vicinamibacterales bacterium]|nr:phenylalanine--tRNA ligase subunit beta [Vicinamibacterales bacterium]
MKLVLSWMREFASVPADVTADVVASRLASCGFEVAEIVEAPEPVIDFEITANRPDCLAIAGLAREASVAFGTPFRIPESAAPADPAAAPVDVTVEDEVLCPRYAAQAARVAIGPSPAWLTERLLAAGVRPINNVVDVTNYVMLERGHPMHAFDLDKLAGRRIVVRRARPGEQLRTLDGVDRALDAGMLVIADGERAAAIAGVMGGADSEVSLLTTTIALESAWFHPRSVRVTSKRLGLKTEASARFERGADIDAPAAAMARAMELLAQIGAGHAIGPIVDRYALPAARRAVRLRASRIKMLLGAEVPADDVRRILEGLGFSLVKSPDAPGWLANVPTWRVDVQREADLIEEVGRHYGYDRLPTTFPALREVAPPPDPRIARDQLARRVLMASGFDEAMTFTFIERKAAEAYAAGSDAIVPVANPLSEKFAVLRPSLLPGLVDALAHNRRHGLTDVRLFESGACFDHRGEHRRVGFAWIGRAAAEHWSAPPREVDFFDARGVAETLCRAFNLEPRYEPTTEPWLVPGRAARIIAGDRGSTNAPPLGSVGQLLPTIVDARGVPGSGAVYVGELDLDALGAGLASGTRMAPLPRFPAIVRDLSILVPDRLPAADVRGTIRTAAPGTLIDVAEFDRYQGKGIPEGRVSLSLHLTFRAPDRTLTDAEVDGAMTAIVHALEKAHGAVRR